MTFTLKSSKYDPVKTYVSENGFYKITKRPSKATWTLIRISLFGSEIIGEFNSLEEAMNF